MHIPDGFISGEINAATFAVALATGGIALWRAQKTLGERQVPVLGVTAAFIFAAQMLNFPIAGGTSGHFLGAVLAALLVGPLNAFLVMSIVLLIQCLMFADGGLTALGTNIVNMGLVGGTGGYLAFRVLHFILPGGRAWFMAAAAAAAWLSVVMAASLCALELVISGKSPLEIALPAMAGAHAVIGIGEAIITTAVMSVLLAARPDLVDAYRPKSEVLSAA
jgi:cobalt/nickel transport system permease protein